MYKSQIIADSAFNGSRLTTFKVTYPRIIHSEVMTHRMFSRNSSSSRAIPIAKMIKRVTENPFVPVAYQRAHRGMQGNEYFTDPLHIGQLVDNWLTARDNAVEIATEMSENGGVTKQLCNRLLEPFMWHTVIITSSEKGLENFFNLRNPVYEIDLDNLNSLKD